MNNITIRFVPLSASALVSLALLSLTLVAGCDRKATTQGTSTQTSQGSKTKTSDSAGSIDSERTSGLVTLKINSDQNNSDQNTRTIEVPAVADGATLESVLRSADGLDADISGSGTTAFVNQIAGRATSGNEGWTFTVDGQWSDKGIGTTILHPPTTVTWTFGEAR